MVYSTRYDKNADRQISDRTDRPPPDLFVPRRDLRYRSGIQQYRGMVVVDPRGRPASQGSAILSSARRKFRIGIRRLRFRAEPFARQFRRTDPAFASRRDFREGQIGQLSPAQSIAELAVVRLERKRHLEERPLGRVSKDGHLPCRLSSFEARKSSRLRMTLPKIKKGARLSAFCMWLLCYFAAGLAGAAPAAGWLDSSFLRASSARFCSSSCSFFW